jgi:hypothetical protein
VFDWDIAKAIANFEKHRCHSKRRQRSLVIRTR